VLKCTESSRQGERAETTAALFEVFLLVESFLRDHHLEYLSRCKLSREEIYAEAKIGQEADSREQEQTEIAETKEGKSDRKERRLALYQILHVYYHAFRRQSIHVEVPQGWAGFTELRNGIAHMSFDVMKGWKGASEVLIRYWHPLAEYFQQINRAGVQLDQRIADLFGPFQAPNTQGDRGGAARR
jgi:hypothetical protein